MRGELSFKKGISFTVFEPDAAAVADVMADALDKGCIKYQRGIVAVPVILESGTPALALAEQPEIDPGTGSAHLLAIFKGVVLPRVVDKT